MSSEKLPKTVGYVYVIDVGDRRKIGCTQNPERRVREILQASGVRNVPYFASFLHENHRDTEKELHEYFDNSHLLGEWFSAHYDDVVSKIQQMVPAEICEEVLDSLFMQESRALTQKDWDSAFPSPERNGPPEFAHFKFNEPGLNEDECLAGYLAGLHDASEPGNDKSRSFHHGWRNGRVDRGHAEPDAAQREYAKSHVRAQRAH